MKYLLALLTITSIGSVLLLISCSDPFEKVKDPQEVVEVPGYNGQGSIQIQDINNSSEIIGFIGYPPGSSTGIIAFEEPPSCFRIQADGASFTEITQAGHLATWPLDINDEGAIAGEYLLEGNYSSDFLPGKAFMLDKDELFMDLHPADAYTSSASHITSASQVFGVYGYTEFESRACLFQSDTVVNLVDATVYPYSKVCATNDSWVVIYTQNQNDEYGYVAYNILSGELQEMDISPEVADFSEIKAINDNDIAVGFYIDLTVSDRAIGIIYDLGNHSYVTYEEKNKSKGAEFLEYNFFDINNSGTIVGWAGREYQGPFLQLRAFTINQDFTGFRDVTPENDDIYSEMVAINDQGIAVGYLGLPRKNNAVLNKMMVIDLSR